MKKNKKIAEELEFFSWKDVNKLIKNKEFNFSKRPLSKETYLFIAKDTNRSVVEQLAFTSLQKTDPENASIEKAIEIAEEMRRFAKRVVEEMQF